MSEQGMEIIVDHFREPRNRGALPDADVVCEEMNPGCGDRVKLQVCLGSGEEITAIRYVGDGCVISMAAASLLTTMVEGRTLREAVRLRDEEMLEALQATISPRRYDCALLAQRALKSGLVRYAHNRRIRSS